MSDSFRPPFYQNSLFEAWLTIFLLIGLLWIPVRSVQVALVLVLVSVAIASMLRRNKWDDLGLGLKHVGSAMAWSLLVAVIFGGVLLLNWSMSEGRAIDDDVAKRFLLYPLWALLQQFLLQSFLHIRLMDTYGPKFATAILAAIMFSLLHMPNPMLAIGTLGLGLACCLVFLRAPCIYPIALCHGLVGAVADTFLDLDLKVGFRYLRMFDLTW